ncbi:MAG: NAD-binding protein [Candidatus Azobacteroides sp.]|nr:NAD-binding protein [Candidatus Azobacteroides sp.]
MKHTISRPFWKNPWIIIIIVLSILGILTGVYGFLEKPETRSDALYDTFQLFIMHHTFEETPECLVNISRWIIFIVIILLSREALLLIIPEQLKLLKIRLFYHDHIIICGLTEESLYLANELFDKNPKERMIFVDNVLDNPLYRSLRNRKVQLIIGDPYSRRVLKLAKICKAKEVFVFTGSDTLNVDIAQAIFSVLESKDRTGALRCFVSIADRELKILLEETSLFKYKTPKFDGILFNVNEMGIKYGICMNIDKILPEKIETVPEILLVGLTEKTEIALLNLAHCLTMQREMFRFTIVEKDETIINFFRKKYRYLEDFAAIEFVGEIENVYPEKLFDSILICIENQTEAIKQAISIRYLLGKNEPNILVFCDEPNTFNNVLNVEGKLNDKGEKEIFPLKDRKIFLINLFEEIAGYVFILDKSIEEKAKMAHDFWNKLYKENKKYDEMSGHFRQTNRNQILDNFLRTFIALGKPFNVAQEHLVSFADNDKETLAMMEHRRWMIEKYENGWRPGERIKPDEFKRHDCLKQLDELPEIQKGKDFDAIDLMIHLLNNQKNEN